MKHIKPATLVFLFLVACAPTQSPAPTAAVITRTSIASPQIVTATATSGPTDAPTRNSTNTATPTDTPTRTSVPTYTPLPPIAISFYRMRIEYSTTADWTTLDIKNSENILTAQLMAINGKPLNAQASLSRLSLNQPLDAAKAGQSVRITVDFALSLDAVNQPLEFLLQKGGINGSVVRLYNVSGDGAQLIQQINHQGIIRGNTDFNPLVFSVDLASLKSTPPRQTPIQHVSPQRMLWAFYYTWYHSSDWSSPELKDRPSTLYVSDSPSAIARQIEQAQSAGIDGFISSWWGPGDYTDKNLKLLLDLAQDRNFKVAIYLETLKDSGPRDADEISRWLAYAISTYRDHPAYMKVNGKPLIVIWASDTVPLATWKNIFATLRQQGLDAVYLANSYDSWNLEVFDGLHQYSMFAIPNLAQTETAAGRAVIYYPLLSNPSLPKIWAATVQPGFDNRLIPGRQGLFKDRNNGTFYRSTFEAALQSDPDWIFITTWNEWWEHTYIEPSELYGNQYLDITREFANKWKGK